MRISSRGPPRGQFRQTSLVLVAPNDVRIRRFSAVERAIRPVALGRKNHLFAGSDGGGVRWATVCSLVAAPLSCQRLPQRPTEDRFLMTRDELENRMSVLLGGRAAELTVFGHLSTSGNNPLMALREIAFADDMSKDSMSKDSGIKKDSMSKDSGMKKDSMSKDNMSKDNMSK